MLQGALVRLCPSHGGRTRLLLVEIDQELGDRPDVGVGAEPIAAEDRALKPPPQMGLCGR